MNNINKHTYGALPAVVESRVVKTLMQPRHQRSLVFTINLPKTRQTKHDRRFLLGGGKRKVPVETFLSIALTRQDFTYFSHDFNISRHLSRTFASEICSARPKARLSFFSSVRWKAPSLSLRWKVNTWMSVAQWRAATTTTWLCSCSPNIRDSWSM